MESDEGSIKTPVLGLRTLQPEATCLLWLCTLAFLMERERPRMDPLKSPRGPRASLLLSFDTAGSHALYEELLSRQENSKHRDQ